MAENQVVTHITQNGQFEVQFERAASANKMDGFKVSAKDDDMAKAFESAKSLYLTAIAWVESNRPKGAPEK